MEKADLRIVAFVQEGVAIKDIMKSMGLPDFRAPPKIPVPQSPDDLIRYHPELL